MAAVFPSGSYYTKGVSLTGTTKTTIYTAGDQQEKAFDITGLSAVASDGTADTLSFFVTLNGTEFVIVFKGPVETDYPLQIEGLPIHLESGDIIKATSTNASASHPTHVLISGVKTTRSPGAK